MEGCDREGLGEIDQKSKFLVRAPSIHFEIAVKREDIPGVQRVRKVHQACVREIDFSIVVFPNDLLNPIRRHL